MNERRRFTLYNLHKRNTKEIGEYHVTQHHCILAQGIL